MKKYLFFMSVVVFLFGCVKKFDADYKLQNSFAELCFLPDAGGRVIQYSLGDSIFAG